MKLAHTMIAATAFALLAGCDTPTSVIATEFSMEVPGGFIGKGAIVPVSLKNESDVDASTGPLPCVVQLERRINGKWVVVSPNAPCPGVVIPVPAGAAIDFAYPMPDEIGTYRLKASAVHSDGAGSVTIRSRAFQTVGIAVN